MSLISFVMSCDKAFFISFVVNIQIQIKELNAAIRRLKTRKV